MCAQLAAFGRVIECREVGKVKARSKEDCARAKRGARKEIMDTVYMNGNGHAEEAVDRGSETLNYDDEKTVLLDQTLNCGISKRAMRSPLKPAIRGPYTGPLCRLLATA